MQVQILCGVLDKKGHVDGEHGVGLLDRPCALAVDRHGGVIIADAGQNTLRRAANGRLTTLSVQWPQAPQQQQPIQQQQLQQPESSHEASPGMQGGSSTALGLATAASIMPAASSSESTAQAQQPAGVTAHTAQGAAIAAAESAATGRPLGSSNQSYASQPAQPGWADSTASEGAPLIAAAGSTAGALDDHRDHHHHQQQQQMCLPPSMAACCMALTSSLDFPHDVLWMYHDSMRALLRMPLDSANHTLVAQAVCQLEAVPQVSVLWLRLHRCLNVGVYVCQRPQGFLSGGKRVSTACNASSVCAYTAKFRLRKLACMCAWKRGHGINPSS